MHKKTTNIIPVLTISITASLLAFNGMESGNFAGPYSSSMENMNTTAIDAAIPGFIGPCGRGVCRPGQDDTYQTAEGDENYINPVFKGWANRYEQYIPAPAADASKIGNETYSPTGGVPEQWRKPLNALGPVTGDNFDVCVLGDLWESQISVIDDSNAGYMVNDLLATNDPNKIQPGQITLLFDDPIANGPGPDFAVFENGFISAGGAGVGGEIFAELGFVEVSSNGVNFLRFPAVSLTDGKVGPYGTIDPSNTYNLAGKHVNAYKSSWGTPFNLSDIANNPLVLNGAIDLNNITHIKIIDIPGNGFFNDNASSNIDPNTIDVATGAGGSHYSTDNPIYDAWVTWGSGGFDLEAIGAIDQIYGDADSNGRVDIIDYARMASRWNKYGNWPQGDFNEDRFIDTEDLILLGTNWLYENE